MKEIPVMKPYFSGNEVAEIAEVIRSGWVAQGEKTAEFEKTIALHEDAKYGIAVSSCTAALHLALAAMGIGQGDDVLVPSFTFVATANVVVYTGATPVFTDVDNRTYTLSIPSIEQIIREFYTWDEDKNTLVNRKTTNRLKAIVAVNLFGLCADIYAVNQLAEKYNLSVLEDSACAIGAKVNGIYHSGFGNPSCVSFHPRKSITTGEGGMVLTCDERFADRVRSIRSHGASISEVDRHRNNGFLLPQYDTLGYNYRMTDIQAALGISQAKKLDFIMAERRKKAVVYHNLLREIRWIRCPYEPEGYFHTYQSYVCVLDFDELGFETMDEAHAFRNSLMLKLAENGIQTRQGTHAVHTLGYYKKRFFTSEDDCKTAYMLDRVSITLPLYIQMEDKEQAEVVERMTDIKKQLLEKRGFT